MGSLLRVVALAVLLTVVGCGAPKADVGAGNSPAPTSQPTIKPTEGPLLGSDFKVKKGSKVTLGEGEVTVAFTEVVNDSRCKPGNTCVWEGDALIRVTLTQKGTDHVLELHSNPKFAVTATAVGRQVKLVALDWDGVEATLNVTNAGP